MPFNIETLNIIVIFLLFINCVLVFLCVSNNKDNNIFVSWMKSQGRINAALNNLHTINAHQIERNKRLIDQILLTLSEDDRARIFNKLYNEGNKPSVEKGSNDE